MNYSKCADETLVELYRTGDEFAFSVIMDRYKPIVSKKAASMFLAGGEESDLLQEGMVGLFNAVMKYDEEMGAKFSTFAGVCIDRCIMNAITAANRQKNRPLNDYVSFYEPAYSDGEAAFTLIDVLEDADENNPEKICVGKDSNASKAQRLLGRLSEFEKKVLELKAMEMDYNQIAQMLGKTPKSIDNTLQRIKAKAKTV